MTTTSPRYNEDGVQIIKGQPVEECAECGHDHYAPAIRDYIECNVCDCQGQE
jgi:hypothetical protein